VSEARPGLRLDKWLWHARFFRTRSLAAKLAARRRVRINGNVTGKPHQLVRPGDVVTFPQGDRVRVVRVVSLGVRRGPAAEAQALYADVETAGSPAVGTVR
jgi:ribosome-associated heat shock protein Hsp15